MKKIKLLFLLLTLGTLPVKADEITLIGTTYCPLLCEGQEKGFMVDIVTSIYEKNGHTLNYKNYPRSRAIELVEQGMVDGLIGQIAGFDDEFVYPEQEAALIKLCFFTDGSSTWTYESSDSLQQVKLGLIRDYGYAAAPQAKQHIDKYDNDPQKIGYIVGKNPMLRILKMINLGRFSATIEDVNIVNYLVQKHDLDSIRNAGCSDTRINSFVIFPRINEKSEQLAQEFDAGLSQLRKTGELHQILLKYGVIDWR